MRKIELWGVLTLLTLVNMLAAVSGKAPNEAANQMYRAGGAVPAPAAAPRSEAQGGCQCANQAPLQRQAVPPEIWFGSYSIQPGQTLTFAGRGFQPNEVVEVRLSGLDEVPRRGNSRLLVAAPANDGGNLEGAAPIPFLSPGDYPVYVVGRASQAIIIRNLTVQGFSPWVVLDNYAPISNAQLGFRGQGFADGEAILVYYDQQDGQPITQVNAGPDGQFVVQAVGLPAQLGSHTLIAVGTLSGAVVSVNFEILPAPGSGPPPASAGLSARVLRADVMPLAMNIAATGGRTSPSQLCLRGHPSQACSMVLLGALGSAASRWGVIGGISLNNPLALVLLVLLTWLLLCVCLAVLLYVLPPLYHWFLRRRAGHGADLPELPGAETGARQSASSLDETPEFGQAAGSLLVPGSLPQQRPGQQETLQQGALQHEARQSARFCPWCGLRNSSGSSSCVGCQRELPQMPGGEVGEGPLSGRTREAQPGLAARVSAASDRGCRRADQENEDSFLAVTGVLWGRDRLQPFGLFVVADGMGGHMDGHKASRAAIESIYRAVVPVVIGEAQPEHALLALLEQAIQGVNERLYQANQQEHTTMGCTVTAALITGHTASICNVGDSRTYLLRPQSSLQRITVDHSLVEGLVVAGLIQRADVYTHPKRNQIFRCLGHQPWVEVDTFRQSLASGDVLLLCSDGLWEMIRDPEMEALLRQTPDLTQASRALVERANAHGGLDNITAIIAQLTEQAPCLARPGVATLSSTDARLLASPV